MILLVFITATIWSENLEPWNIFEKRKIRTTFHPTAIISEVSTMCNSHTSFLQSSQGHKRQVWLLHCTDKENEAQRNDVTCPRTYSHKKQSRIRILVVSPKPVLTPKGHAGSHSFIRPSLKWVKLGLSAAKCSALAIFTLIRCLKCRGEEAW